MDLYFAKLGLYKGNNVDASSLFGKARDISNWLENRGFQITRKTEIDFSDYHSLEESLTRYGVTLCNDLVADLSVRKRNRRLKLSLDLASNNLWMIPEVLSGMKESKLKLDLEQDYSVTRVGDGSHFRRLEYGDVHTVRRIVSVAELKDFLNVK